MVSAITWPRRELIVGLTICLLSGPLASAATRPNVLFIAVDDLNDWVGCLGGHPQALTPNLDRLAERGVLFANAHCAATACNPSRAAVFTGRMPNATHVWSNSSGSIDDVSPGIRQLPVTFAEAGYRTFGTGKLYHQKRLASKFQVYKAFGQRWSPFTSDSVRYTEKELATKGTNAPRHLVNDSQGQEIVLPRNRMPSDRNPDTPKGESFDWGGFDLPDSDWGDTRITDWAIERLRVPQEKPLFLGVGYYRPHIPLFAPSRFFERFRNTPGILPSTREDDLDDLSPLGSQWATDAVTAGLHSTVLRHNQWRPAVEAYLACTTYVDAEIGRLVTALDKSSMADNTLIVLWSDHGWHLGEKQHWGKWTGWERSTRVPLIIVPSKNATHVFANPGSICKRTVGLIDLFPTLIDLCELVAPSNLDGQSLVPLLRDPKAPFRETTLTMFDKGNASVRNERWRYLAYEDGSEELYDLHADPQEWTNVAGKARLTHVKSALRNELQRHLSRYDVSEKSQSQ